MMNEQICDMMDVEENEKMTKLEKDAMKEMDDLVDLFQTRDSKTRLIRREHDRMQAMVRDQQDKIRVYEMRQDHVNQLLAQIEQKLHEAQTDEERFLLKDQTAMLMKELRHIQRSVERSKMVHAKFQNEAQRIALEIESMQASLRRTREKADELNEGHRSIVRETMKHDHRRAALLSRLFERLASVDTDTLQALLTDLEEKKIDPTAEDQQRQALDAIEPKIRLIRESNLYGMIDDAKKERVDTMIKHYQQKMKSCDDPRILEHFVKDFEKTAFPRLFKMMADFLG